MAGISKVILIGNLGRDPETGYTPSGKMNVRFTMAVGRKFRDNTGALQDRTTWFRVTGWGQLAETMDKLAQQGALTKGKQVYVEGRLETQEYTDKDGQNRMSLEVSATELQLLGSRGDNDGGYGGDQDNAGGGGYQQRGGGNYDRGGNSGGGNYQQRGNAGGGGRSGGGRGRDDDDFDGGMGRMDEVPF